MGLVAGRLLPSSGIKEKRLTISITSRSLASGSLPYWARPIPMEPGVYAIDVEDVSARQQEKTQLTGFQRTCMVSA